MDGRFAAIPKEMFEDERLKPLDIVVYAALDTFVNGTGEAWPSLSILAQRAGVSSASVKRSLPRLTAGGYIVRQQRRAAGSREFDCTLYRLPFRCGGVGTKSAEVGVEGAGVGSEMSAGLAPTARKVGSQRAGNDTHITIPKERECGGSFRVVDVADLERRFEELRERYPRKSCAGEAKRVFMGLFPAGISREEARRRLAAISERFAAFEEDSEYLVARGEERYIPHLHNWLAREGFADV